MKPLRSVIIESDTEILRTKKIRADIRKHFKSHGLMSYQVQRNLSNKPKGYYSYLEWRGHPKHANMQTAMETAVKTSPHPVRQTSMNRIFIPH